MSQDDLHRRARKAYAAYCGALRGPVSYDGLSPEAQELWRRFASAVGKPEVGRSIGSRIDAGRTLHARTGRQRTPYDLLSPQRQLRWRRALNALDYDLGV